MNGGSKRKDKIVSYSEFKIVDIVLDRRAEVVKSEECDDVGRDWEIGDWVEIDVVDVIVFMTYIQQRTRPRHMTTYHRGVDPSKKLYFRLSLENSLRFRFLVEQFCCELLLVHFGWCRN